MLSSASNASTSMTSIATAAHSITPAVINRTPACFSFVHHAHHISPFLASKKPAISPALFAPPLMQPATESRFRLFRTPIDDLPFEPMDFSFDPTNQTSEPATVEALTQKLPHDITFCHKNEIASLLLPAHAIQPRKTKATQTFLDQFTPAEKALLKEKLLQINPKLTHWTAHQNACLLVKADISKTALSNYLSHQLGAFITPDEIDFFLEPFFGEHQRLPKGLLLDLTPFMKLAAQRFFNETLLNDRHLNNLQQLETTDASIDQLCQNFFSFVDAPKKSTIFKAASLMAALKVDETFYWVQQRLAVSQHKLPQWLADSEFLAAEKIQFEESILKALRGQDPTTDISNPQN
jgi:hypothetical protein